MDSSTAKCCTGYVIKFAGCPIPQIILQTEIALSSTESEYTSLSTVLHQVIPLMNMLRELREKNIVIKKYIPRIYCKVFEDNSGALELPRKPKLKPRTKFINCRYHHFRSFVETGKIKIYAV